MNEGLPLATAAVGRLADVWVYLSTTPLLGLTVTLLVYHAAFLIYRRSGFHSLANPVGLSVIALGSLLWATGTPYATYFEGAQFVHFLLGPATVALAVPLYRQWCLVRRSALAISVSLLAGSLTAIATATGVAWIMGSPPAVLASLAPKSVTAPVAMAIAEQIGGLPSLTAVLVIVTGIFGAMFGPLALDLAGITDWRARGLAMGTASHGIGTARALQVNETAGAFSGLAMGLNALATALLLPILWGLWG